jgi:hypothetical protein
MKRTSVRRHVRRVSDTKTTVSQHTRNLPKRWNKYILYQKVETEVEPIFQEGDIVRDLRKKEDFTVVGIGDKEGRLTYDLAEGWGRKGKRDGDSWQYEADLKLVKRRADYITLEDLEPYEGKIVTIDNQKFEFFIEHDLGSDYATFSGTKLRIVATPHYDGEPDIPIDVTDNRNEFLGYKRHPPVASWTAYINAIKKAVIPLSQWKTKTQTTEKDTYWVVRGVDPMAGQFEIGYFPFKPTKEEITKMVLSDMLSEDRPKTSDLYINEKEGKIYLINKTDEDWLAIVTPEIRK